MKKLLYVSPCMEACEVVLEAVIATSTSSSSGSVSDEMENGGSLGTDGGGTGGDIVW